MSRFKGGIPCQRIQGMLSEYIDGKLNKADKGVVEAHLEVCNTCSRELQALRMTVQLLHSAPEVPVPRSFRVTVPKRDGVFVHSGFRSPRPVNAPAAIALSPASLRWLRPATAVAAIALVLLLVGDFVHVFENDSGVDGGGEATSTYSESVDPAAAMEQQTMVKVPGVIGQMSLATAKSAGYTKYDVLPPTPVTEPAAQLLRSPEGQLVLITAEEPVPIVIESADSSQDKTVSQTGETEVGWPLRQIEIALGAVVFILIVSIILLRRRRGRIVA